MLQRIIDFSLKNKFIVLLATAALVLGGVYAVRNIPLDAIPDLSDTQVIIYTPMGRPGAEHHRRPGHLSHHDEDAVRAAAKGRARLLLLRVLVRLCHFRGRHGSLLGAQPRARISQRLERAVAQGRDAVARPGRHRRRLGVHVFHQFDQPRSRRIAVVCRIGI